ncbi:hypothetical protein [Methanobrevibacter sp.]|uniref:hypothetical protein n=1 Tax=Methanobrevibacter sp. TaxID=66852 RepID=UPI00388FF87D
MKKCCQNCKFYLEQSIGNVCRLDFYSVKSTDCCKKYEDCIEEKDDNWWKTIKRVITIVLILTGINSLFADFIFSAIKKLNEVKK